MFHEGLLISVLLYGSETMIWREKERSKIRAVQMNNLRSLLSVKIMNRLLNTWIRELYGVVKGVDEGILCWFSHIGRIENYRIAKRVYV